MNNEDLRGNPVLSLQYMLRNLATIHDFLPFVPLDGIFGETTLEAVLLFQKEIFPPATGVVNQEVWEAMGEELVKEQENIEKPRVLRAYPEGGDPLIFGEERSEIALFQLMFQLLSQEISEIEEESPSGNFTKILENNVKWIQSVSGIPETGELDAKTWDRLARLYEIYITKV